MSFRLAALLSSAMLLIGPFATGLPLRPPPAYACTAFLPLLEEVAAEADAIVIVTAIRVGSKGLEHPLAALPEVELGAGTLLPPDHPAAQQQWDFTGLGATMHTEMVLAGKVPARFEVDANQRLLAEALARKVMATPGFVLPCALGFFVPRYEAGSRYLLFLKHTEGGWQNLAPRSQPLADGFVQPSGIDMSFATYKNSFAQLGVDGVHIQVDDEGEPSVVGFSMSARLPLDVYIEVALALHGSAHPDNPPRIWPPSTGDAGLR